MPNPKLLNPTFLGIFAVFVWGVSLPIIRVLETQIGLLPVIGVVYSGCGAMGLLKHFIRRERYEKKIFRNPVLYLRWFLFVAYVGGIFTTISICSKQNMPIVILLNYVWPSAILFCSILIAGVRVKSWSRFTLGSLIIFISLFLEIVGPHAMQAHIFANRNDCIAYAATFIIAWFFGLYCALTKRTGDTTGGAMVIPLFQLTMGLALPLSFMPHWASWSALTLPALSMLLGYTFFQFFAFQGWDLGMRRGNVVILSLFADFIPWISLLTAHLLIGIKIGEWTILSAIGLVCGAMIVRFSTKQKQILDEEEPPVA